MPLEIKELQIRVIVNEQQAKEAQPTQHQVVR
jgi:hypothetical protein